jgi:hypothetical protein
LFSPIFFLVFFVFLAGTWGLRNGNLSGKFPAFKKTAGNIIFELISSATDLHGIHYVQGEVVLRDGVYISDGDLQMKMEGVYIWPFRQLRMVLTSSMDSDMNREEDFVQSSPYHLLGVFSSQVLKDSPRDYSPHLKKSSSIAEMGKTCSIQLVTQVSTVLSDNKREHFPAIQSFIAHTVHLMRFLSPYQLFGLLS